MRFANLYVRTAVLASVALAAGACQTAQKPVSLLPPTSAPGLHPTPPTASAPTPVAKPVVARAQNAPAPKTASPESAAPADTASTAQTADTTSDPVGELVARAEKEYQAGLANHQAGKTEDAKQNFDNALNALLSSSLDVRSDNRLQTEFDRIVAGVNQLYPGGPNADSDSSQEAPQEAQQNPSLLPSI